MHKLLAIAVGGSIGALMRYWISDVAYRVLGVTFPWGTLFVNAIGCFLIGLLWALFDYYIVNPNWRLALLTGFLGAFTTFSTFALETFNLMQDNEFKVAAMNVLFSVLLGLVLVYIGIIAGRQFITIFR